MKMIAFCDSINSLHDGLEALLELAAVLGAGDDQGKVESQDALVSQERWNLAVGDALGQTLDDGSLADAGFADQHRIVLGAAAEDLDDANRLRLRGPPGDRAGCPSRLGQVTREFGEQGRFALPLGLGFSPGWCGQFFRESWRGAVRARAGFPRQTFFFA